MNFVHAIVSLVLLLCVSAGHAFSQHPSAPQLGSFRQSASAQSGDWESTHGPEYEIQSVGILGLDKLKAHPSYRRLSTCTYTLPGLVAEKGPTAVKVIGYTMARTIDWLDWVGDAQSFAWLKSLGDRSLPHPLVSFTGNTASMRETEVHLTDIGRSVLAGEANFVTLNGIDDWVGGIHLDSAADRVWLQRNGVIVADHHLLG